MKVRGTVVQFYQYKSGAGGGKKAPAKVVLSTEGEQTEEFKSWSSVSCEIGQTVEITYETQQSGQYTNNMIVNLEVIADSGFKAQGNHPAPSGGGREVSIEKQVCLKAAAEITSAIIAASGGKGLDKEAVEGTYEALYQAGVNLLTYGVTSKDPFADE